MGRVGAPRLTILTRLPSSLEAGRALQLILEHLGCEWRVRLLKAGKRTESLLVLLHASVGRSPPNCVDTASVVSAKASPTPAA